MTITKYNDIAVSTRLEALDNSRSSQEPHVNSNIDISESHVTEIEWIEKTIL